MPVVQVSHITAVAADKEYILCSLFTHLLQRKGERQREGGGEREIPSNLSLFSVA